MMASSLAIGVDLGGSNLRAAVFADGKLTPVAVHRSSVGADRRPEAIIARLVSVVAELTLKAGGSAAPVVPVGIGIAAMLSDRAGTVANSPHLGWRDVPFGRLLANALGSGRAVGVYNDVNAITWGEHVAGAAIGERDVLAVYVGTGIGAGIISGGALLEGATNCAGEIGHVKVAWDDQAPRCACGARGCIEAYVGGSYVERRIRAELGAGITSSITVPATEVTAGDVDAAAAAGDPWAVALWNELAPLLGAVLANAIALLNPRILILGGGLLSRTPELRMGVEKHIRLLAPVAHSTPLVISSASLGDDAGLVGAARLAAARVSIING